MPATHGGAGRPGPSSLGGSSSRDTRSHSVRRANHDEQADDEGGRRVGHAEADEDARFGEGVAGHGLDQGSGQGGRRIGEPGSGGLDPRKRRASGRTRAGAHMPTKPTGPARVTASVESRRRARRR
ncbi:hypothetical protein ADK75_19020 [Streptomyces virginiae]|uniref:Uncharacterized protein n=1 Tax=Streptomyces virginiae TaxID=1961 RepID=A0A0L8MHW9_STRVG|nr:hypothetical protein ADK75_19020 [Streptomyces virginiae]